MPADVYSSGIGVLLMGTGNDNNAWGINANSSIFQIFEDAISGRLVSAVTGGTLDLSTPAPPSAASLARYKVLAFTGTISSPPQIVKVPAISKSWYVENNCTADIYLQTPSGTQITIPTGTVKHVYCDGTNVKRIDGTDVGKVSMFASVTPAGYLECDGSSLLRTSYPDLYNKIGTNWGTVDLNHFTLPKLTDTGRFPRSRRPGTDDVGTSYANQVGTHTHTGSVSVTGTTDVAGAHAHTASVNDPQHIHPNTVPTVALFASIGGSQPFWAASNTGGSGSTLTNITVAVDVQGNHSHNVSASGALAINATGGTEVRPESVVFRFCIKY